MDPETYSTGYTVAEAAPEQRTLFIRNTYVHLAFAIMAFVVLEAALFSTGLPVKVMELLGTSRYSWLIVLGAFMGVSYLAQSWASGNASPQRQYLGLGLYVVAEAIVFMPLLFIAAAISGPETIFLAGFITIALFAGLTFTAFTTKKDFTFLGSFLKVGGFIALGVIAASILFGFNLGLFFAAVMVLFAAGSILYETSNIMYRYHPAQHVAASLALFASVALLFWYVLRIVMGSGRR